MRIETGGCQPLPPGFARLKVHRHEPQPIGEAEAEFDQPPPFPGLRAGAIDFEDRHAGGNLGAALGEGVAAGNVTDAVSALANLGYSSAQASAAVARVVAKEGEAVATEKLIRLGLRELSN